MGAASERGTSGVVEVDGSTELAYLAEGEGLPCLAVGSTRLYPPVFSQELRHNLRFIFADTRFFGFPRSPTEYERITLDTLLNDADQIRRASGANRVMVLGHSAMGLLALEYARKYPQHASHVIMIGTPPYALVEIEGSRVDFAPEVTEFWERDASKERKAMLDRNREQLTEERLSRVPPGKTFGVWYLAHGPMVWHEPSYDASWLFEPIEFDSPTFNHFMGTILKGYDVGESLRQVNAPVFLALGRYDYLVPYVLWEDNKSMPNLSYNLFERSGHYPMMEEQTVFDRKLLEWLRSG